MRQESKCKGKWHVTWKSSSVPIHLNPDQTSFAVTLHFVKLSSSPSAFCLSGKSNSALRSSLLLCMCVTSPKYSLSYWRPVQPVLCLSDVFTMLCPTSPRLSLRQGKFCLLRHSSLLLPHPNPTPTLLSSDIYQRTPICSLMSPSRGCLRWW